MKKCLLLMLLVACGGALSAQNQENRLGVWDSENRHSLSFSVGFMPILLNYYTSQSFTSTMNNWQEIEEINPNYFDYYEGTQFSTPIFSLNYFYRIGRLLSVGCSVGYGHESTKFSLKESGHYDAITVRDNVLLVTPMLRLHWLNTSRVEMYSGLGIISYGLSVISNAYCLEGYRSTNEGVAMQITPIGVGVKLDRTYIFSELGLGSHGLFRVGVGHRF